ncbi:MAG: glycosyltransferase 87 family protein [Candidatus Korobacteraceae bacterium]
MPGQAQVERFHGGDIAARLSRLRPQLLFATAVLGLLSSWYFAAVIAPAGLGLSAPSVQQGLFPEWFGCREILHHRNPYRAEATRQIELVIFGRAPTASASPLNQHRFAYPVFFVFLFFPIALLPFATAQVAAFFVCVFLTAISLPLWLPGPQFSNLDKLTFTLFALATYPIVLALQLRQPTLIFLSLLAAVYFWVQSGRLVLAGMLAAFCAAKPQLAIAVLLPLSIWSVAAWRIRKAFVLSLGATLSVLLVAAEFAVPGWFAEWLATLAAYAHYAGGKPPLADLLCGHFVLPAAALLLGAAVCVSFKFQASDLLFAISFSAAIFQLLFPFQIYNAVLLFPAVLWLIANANTIMARGQLLTLLYSCTWIVLGAGWISAAGLSLSNVLVPGVGLMFWQLPLAAAYLYPFAVAACLGVYAVSKSRAGCTPLGRMIDA